MINGTVKASSWISVYFKWESKGDPTFELKEIKKKD
jgi:hypothetical protein